MHPTITEQLAKDVQSDRLAQAAQARLIRNARAPDPQLAARREKGWRRLTGWQLKRAGQI